jgi:LacI family transcriptional regulator/LacI family repressor for deo operon, udp, cdd, tsx, nupC, and nupG
VGQRIGEKTKQRILALAKEMDYIPSKVAKSLIANRTWTIGMVLPTISDPFMGRVIEGVEYAAIAAGFNVFLSTSQNDYQRELAIIEVFQQRRVDGIIVIASHLIDRYSRYFDGSKMPIVVIDEQELGETIHFVTVDDIHGSRLAVDHLVRLGHRQIGYVGVTNRPKSNRYRLRGYQLALEAHGIAYDPALVFDSDALEDHAKRGEASVAQLTAAGATAIFCFNDSIALGVLAGCYGRGLVVPNDLSVVGFDDIDTAAYSIPPLTTIRQPRFELGRQAMRMLLDILDDRQPDNIILYGELVIRATTAQPVVSGKRRRSHS